MQNSIERESWKGVEVYRLENRDIAVWLCPELGNNLYRIKDKKAGREILRTPKSPDDLRKQPEWWGTPILFPPNRIKDGTFVFHERRYHFPINTPEGNHIHGFLLNKPWHAATISDEDGVLSTSSIFRIIDFPDIFRGYPHALEFMMNVRITGCKIEKSLTVHNRSTEEAPFGFGLHTWFNLDDEPKRWSLKIPVDSIWELTEDCMPTGKTVPLGKYFPFTKGSHIGSNQFDTLFYIGESEREVTLYRDDGYRILYEPSDEFLHWVVFFTDAVKDSLCLEPYTWVTNAPNLDIPHSKSGLMTIKPGEMKTVSVNLEIVR